MENPTFDRKPEEDDVVRPAYRNTRRQGEDRQREGGSAESSGRAETPPFETRRGGRYVFRGAITEISHQVREQNAFERWGNAVFRGEPYRTGRDMRQSVVRIEEFTTGRRAVRMQDVVFCGDAEGRFIVGDDVTVTAVRCGGDYFVTQMDVHATGNRLLPANRIPAFAIRLTALTVLCLLVSVAAGVYGFFAHDGINALVDGLMSVIMRIAMALLPVLIPLAIIWYFAGRLFRFRRRR
jgi:hypothetical protein